MAHQTVLPMEVQTAGLLTADDILLFLPAITVHGKICPDARKISYMGLVVLKTSPLLHLVR
jgi:hypothetical protein